MKKLLVANRGEIALRIMRTARQMGIATVAVHSDADADAPHVQFADEAYLVGPAPSNQSYLNVEAVLAACKASGADAVHPGYGFLSENAEFAERITQEGITWIGPPASAIRVMGDKLSAKAAAAKFDVPLVPGSEGALATVEAAQVVADQIGYPVMIKASAGGGGKGMRIVHSSNEVREAFENATSEALKSFGNGEVFVEKFVTSPRHIEIQVLSDQHGTHLHLFERECSVQRRHQKVVEEAPSAILSDALRAQMGAAAVKAAQSCGYVGAGTVEFIFDASGAFYFLEMNTRLQVEHPVTEEVTGLDLVAEQIRIARGEKLPYRQEDLKLNGHAIELRVYAEDVTNNFAPDTGVLEVYRRPTGAGIRVDDGVREGQEVPVYYDPMLAKLIVHADSREAALQRLQDALAGCQIFGLPSNIGFLEDLVAHPAVQRGDIDTGFLDRNLNEVLKQPEQLPAWHTIAAAYFSLKAAEHAVSSAHSGDPWSERDFWRQHGHAAFRVAMKHHADYELFLIRLAGDQLSLSVHDAVFEARIRDAGRDMVSLDLDGRHHTLHCFHYDNALVVHDGRRRSHWQIRIPGSDAGDGANRSDGFIRAPMPGKLAVLKVQSGQSVQAGDELAIMESMKMELSIKAPGNGSITGILAEAGSMLDSDAGIFSWEPAND